MPAVQRPDGEEGDGFHGDVTEPAPNVRGVDDGPSRLLAARCNYKPRASFLAFSASSFTR